MTMGYTTDFESEFKVIPALTKEHMEYLTKFSETRRMKRDPEIVVMLPDPVRETVSLNVGTDGEYFVGGGKDFGQDGEEVLI